LSEHCFEIAQTRFLVLPKKEIMGQKVPTISIYAWNITFV